MVSVNYLIKKIVGISLIDKHNQSFNESSTHLFARNIQVPVIYLSTTYSIPV